MGQEIVREIKLRLKAIYKDYRFDVKCSQDNKLYTITVFKDLNNLGSYSVESNTPMNNFLNDFKLWMKDNIINLR